MGGVRERVLLWLDRAWVYVATSHERIRWEDQRGRPSDFPPFRWLADWLIDRGGLVGPEGGWFREYRFRRPFDPQHPWRTDWAIGQHRWFLQMIGPEGGRNPETPDG